jgi:hexosaminidase
MKFLTHLPPLLLSVAPALAVWPAPSSITTGTSALWIDDSIEVTYNDGSPVRRPFLSHSCLGPGSPTNQAYLATQQIAWSDHYEADGPDFSSQDIVHGAVCRALDAILYKNFVPWKLYGRNAINKSEPSANSYKALVTSLEITQTGQDNSSTWKPQAGQVDESYSLSLGTDGVAKIEAVSAVGILHALESFVQLFYEHSKGGIFTSQVPVDIKDAPKFPHRGILLDVARTYYPVESILRSIDAMSYNKLNRLHLHITDSQSWPLEIPAMPELTETGAYAPWATYSTDDVEKIQVYGIQRGVEVILEIDTPGHIGIVAESHPDIITGWGADPWTTYCAEPPCGQFRLNEPKVDDFLDTLMGDLLPRVSPYSAYFHTGGDEVNFQEYLLDPSVGTNDTAVLGPLLQNFTDKNLARVRSAGLVPFVWEEIVKDYNVTIKEDVVVQSWLGGGAIKLLTSQGYKVIDSDYNFWVSTLPADQLTATFY